MEHRFMQFLWTVGWPTSWAPLLALSSLWSIGASFHLSIQSWKNHLNSIQLLPTFAISLSNVLQLSLHNSPVGKKLYKHTTKPPSKHTQHFMKRQKNQCGKNYCIFWTMWLTHNYVPTIHHFFHKTTELLCTINQIQN